MIRIFARAIVGFLVAGAAFGVYLFVVAQLFFAYARAARMSSESFYLISNVVPLFCLALALLTAWGVDRAWNRKAKSQ